MDKNRIDNLVEKFTNKFKCAPTYAVKSCGRLEVIGNHVDYASGYLINSSIENMSIIGVCARRNDDVVYIESLGYEPIIFKTSEIELDIKTDNETSRGLAKGIFKFFSNKYLTLGGFNLLMDSTLPIGVGVSSSAAFSMVVSKTLSGLYNDDSVSKVTLALASQWAENVYFGKKCGLQDQLGSASNGMELLDFKDQQNPVIENFIPKLGDYTILLVKSKTSHADATAAFNSIPNDYEIISKKYNAPYLRFVNWGDFMKDFPNNEQRSEYKRAYHYMNELDRVKRSYDALLSGNVKEFVNCIRESGLSNKNYLRNILIDGQETSNLLEVFDATNKLVKDGAVRVHGGGFGGACFVIINKNEIYDYVKEIAKIVGDENIYQVEISNNALEWVTLE